MSKSARKQYGYGSDHLYTVQSDPHYGILAGQSTGHQWLISENPDGHLLVKFGPSGELTEPLLLKADQPKQRAERLEDWKAEVGFETKPIRIRKFYLDRYQLGIADLPSGMQEAVDSPDEFDEEELEMVMADIDGWLKDGQFVLKWGNEYYMNAAGEVESS